MSGLQGSAGGRAAGFSDWVGAAARRRRAVTDTVLDVFASWGYEYLATPLVEPLDTVAAGVSGGLQTDLFRFMDADGSLLALVGERTVSVARVVATQMRGQPFPLRLCYAGPVLFNRTPLGGRRREAMQAGCEVIGHAGLEADAECVAVAAAALEAAGVSGVQIDVGHADFIPSLLASARLGSEERSRVAAALRRHDLVAVEEALHGTRVEAAERALLLSFPTLRGGRDLLDTAGLELSSGARRPLEELARLWDLLQAHGITDRVHLDLGAVRDWEYYTGPTFELFSAGLGFPLGSGGRYDRLLGSFGLDAPATGFVLHVDRCCDALLRGDGGGGVTGREQGEGPLSLGYAPGRGSEAMVAAARLRSAGVAVALALAPSADQAEPAGTAWAARVDAGGELRWRCGGLTGAGLEALASRCLGGARAESGAAGRRAGR